MALFYVAHQGALLVKREGRIIVKKQGKVISWILTKDIEQLIIVGNITLSPGVYKYLLENGIDTVFLSIYGKYRGKLAASPGKNIFLRINQFNFFQSFDSKVKFATYCVKEKLDNCKQLLRKRNYKLKSDNLKKIIAKMRIASRGLINNNELESVRGFEGIGAKTYFEGLAIIFDKTEFSFKKRTRRPPRDRVNALMSFYYTLMTNRITSIILKTGLDPYLGALHLPSYGRPSLALDILESYRPFIDNIILNAVNKKIIKPTDFVIRKELFPIFKDEEEMVELDESDYPVLLSHSGLKTAVHYFETCLQQRKIYEPNLERLSINQIIEKHIRSLIKVINGELEQVEGFKLL